MTQIFLIFFPFTFFFSQQPNSLLVLDHYTLNYKYLECIITVTIHEHFLSYFFFLSNFPSNQTEGLSKCSIMCIVGTKNIEVSK
ncbi:hypothetical protein ACB094_02G183100 [Castanea mollissima]